MATGLPLPIEAVSKEVFLRPGVQTRCETSLACIRLAVEVEWVVVARACENDHENMAPKASKARTASHTPIDAGQCFGPLVGSNGFKNQEMLPLRNITPQHYKRVE